jgi:hypothetical protein
LVPIPKKKTPKKKVVVVKNEDEEGEKARKFGWMVKYYTSLLYLTKNGVGIAKNAKKKVNFVFILEIQPLWGLNFHFLKGRERN